jgi:uncharacterized RDD family membrane protein YckC
MTDNSNVTTRNTQAPNNSTLIEFPGVNRNRPAWRKELSEAETAPPATAEQSQTTLDEARASAKSRASESASKQLGLVPTPDEPELNPLVAAALARIERARASAHVTRSASGRGQAATAAARVVEEQPVQEAPEPVAPPPPPLVVVQPKQQSAKAEQPQTLKAEPAAEAFVEEIETAVVTKSAAQTSATREVEVETFVEPVTKPSVAEAAEQPRAAAVAEAESASRQPRHLTGVLDEFWLERQGIELLPKVEEKELTYDDRAPRFKRMAVAVIDLLIVALLCAPFAAAIELTIGNWQDPRVWGSMALIAALVMFLYHTCSVALAGRTLGMRFGALHAVDARKACVPTTGQCARRALVYMLSLATGGLGILYSLFDAEGRTVHDILSGTVVVRK